MRVYKCDRCGDIYDHDLSLGEVPFIGLDLCPDCYRKLLEWLRAEDYYREKEIEKQTLIAEPLVPLKPLRGIKK